MHVSGHKGCVQYYIAVLHDSVATDGSIFMGAGGML